MMTIPISAGELREKLTVWRPTEVSDGQGGWTLTLVEQSRPVRAKVSQPSAEEQIEAQRAGAALMLPVHLLPTADVRRGDELRRPDGDRLRVKFTIHPSEPVYLLASCEQLQAEGQREIP
jgi:hypothetical protein